MFPYFGEATEPHAAGGPLVEGDAILEPKAGLYKMNWIQATVGNNLPSLNCVVTLYCEPGYRYEISSVSFRWLDLNKPKREGRATLKIKIPILEGLRHWHTLMVGRPDLADLVQLSCG
jgi:hypothetical protein